MELLSGYSVYNRVNFYEYNKLKFICFANGFTYVSDENAALKAFSLYFSITLGALCVCSFFWMFLTNYLCGMEWAALNAFFPEEEEEISEVHVRQVRPQDNDEPVIDMIAYDIEEIARTERMLIQQEAIRRWDSERDQRIRNR